MQTFTGKQMLQIDIASNYGLDKGTWDERLEWFKDNQNNLMELLSTAETPALYYAGVKAYEAMLNGHSSGYPISLDATSSGLQLLAALTTDRKAASLCNVLDTGSREDAYMTVYRTMLKAIGEDSKIKRDDVKQAVMTSLYGSKAVPKEIFGEGALLNVFYETMQGAAPIAWDLNQAFMDIWDDTKLCNSWVLPDNFHVHIKVMGEMRETVHWLNEPFETSFKMNMTMEEGRSLGANTIHSLDGMIVREMTRRCNYNMKQINKVWDLLDEDAEEYVGTDDDKIMVQILWDHYKNSGYLSARILDHLNEKNVSLVHRDVIIELLDSLPKKPFEIMSIHDCFRCLPNYANDLRKQYNNQLALIAKSNLLSYLLSQITGRAFPIEKPDAELWKEIQHSNYALS